MVSYILPARLLQPVMDGVARSADLEHGISVEDADCSTSAPRAEELAADLEGGAADLVMFCSPTMVELLAAGKGACASLLGVPVPSSAPGDAPPRPFAAHEYGGEGIHYMEVVVTRRAVDEGRARADVGVEGLRGARLAFNDRRSLSGFFCVAAASPAGLFGSAVASGGHERSLEMLRDGEADCCAVDSQVLARLARERPHLLNGLVPVTSLGPYSTQPVVAAARLGPALVARLGDALAAAAEGSAAALKPLRLAGFVRAPPRGPGFGDVADALEASRTVSEGLLLQASKQN